LGVPSELVTPTAAGTKLQAYSRPTTKLEVPYATIGLLNDAMTAYRLCYR